MKRLPLTKILPCSKNFPPNEILISCNTHFSQSFHPLQKSSTENLPFSRKIYHSPEKSPTLPEILPPLNCNSPFFILRHKWLCRDTYFERKVRGHTLNWTILPGTLQEKYFDKFLFKTFLSRARPNFVLPSCICHFTLSPKEYTWFL